MSAETPKFDFGFGISGGQGDGTAATLKTDLSLPMEHRTFRLLDAARIVSSHGGHLRFTMADLAADVDANDPIGDWIGEKLQIIEDKYRVIEHIGVYTTLGTLYALGKATVEVYNGNFTQATVPAILGAMGGLYALRLFNAKMAHDARRASQAPTSVAA